MNQNAVEHDEDRINEHENEKGGTVTQGDISGPNRAEKSK